MLNKPTPRGGSRRSAVALIALCVLSARLVAQPVEPAPPAEEAAPPGRPEVATTELKPLIVSALQVPRDPAKVTAAVTVLDPQSLEERGITQLREALNESPGVISTSTSGQTGAPGVLFIRGMATKYAQVVMDGMRLSDSNNQLNSILGSARVYDVGNIEILRGPQGAIYGGESVGGVLWMETPRGSGPAHGSSTVEAGSFNSLTTYSTYQGQTGDLSYYVGGGYEETDNDAPHNRYQQGNTALRLEGKISPVWVVGTTFRAIDAEGEDLDNFYSVNSQSQVDSALSTIYATGKISDTWTARFHVGYYQEFYDNQYFDTWMQMPGSYFTDLRAGSISTDHEIKLADHVRLLAGIFLHEDRYENGSDIEERGTRYGAHAVLEWDVMDDLTTTGSLRWEDYDVFGSELTWRWGSIYTYAATGTTVRGGVGTSFRAPSYMELFYEGFGNQPNPGLDAESSLGWDLGIEQKVGSHHTVEATWFHNRISDAITTVPLGGYTTTSINQDGDVTTDGLELGLRGSWLDETLSYRLAWTYLHESQPNSGQPRNAATASLDWKPTDKVLVGVGATHLSNHRWTGKELDAYTVARIYGSYQISERVKLHARVENVLNEDYQLYASTWSPDVVEGAGTGFFAGLTVDW